VGWKEDVVAQKAFRKQLMELAAREGANRRELCRQFQVSEKTFYKWQARYRREGEAGLENRSRRPLRSPFRVGAEMETAVLEASKQYPDWGARKIETVLERCSEKKPPARSTIHNILVRHGCIDAEESVKHRPYQRFEHEKPNDLWQMDFKGWFAMGNGQACQPLTVLDDHSRYALCLMACVNQRAETVQGHLTAVFREHGLPVRMTMDNGSPWGSDRLHRYTPLTAWLMRLGIRVGHSRPYHPQSQGKIERFHRTLKRELLKRRTFQDVEQTQKQFDVWRNIYNQQRPHEALTMAVPSIRYCCSNRVFPEKLPAVHTYYKSTDIVRIVDVKGRVGYSGRRVLISKGFRGFPVALRQIDDHTFDVYFCRFRVGRLDTRNSGEGLCKMTPLMKSETQAFIKGLEKR
jgi:transposase InsO family protein